MSDSVRSHRRQPTRLPRPWDSPGKNTGLGFHFLLQCMKGKSESEVAQSCPTLRDPMVCSLSGSSIHGIFQARVLEWGAIAFSDFVHNSLIILCLSALSGVTSHFHFWFCWFDSSLSLSWWIWLKIYHSVYLLKEPAFSFINLYYCFFLSFPLNIVVSFSFNALFPSWHFALVLFSSLCFG